MKLHVIEHVNFEGVGSIDSWVKKQGAVVSVSRMFNNELLPSPKDLDWLIILGGPMSIHDEIKYPWLKREKQFIQEALQENCKIVGICLGAQLIAHSLGASVIRNEYKEIGWFPVKLTQEALKMPLLAGIPHEFTALHWHGETFDIPKNCKHIAMSAACKNQAFIYQNRVLALQFHVESTRDSVNQLLANCSDEMTPGPYVQSAKEISTKLDNLPTIEKIIDVLFNNLQEHNQ